MKTDTRKLNDQEVELLTPFIEEAQEASKELRRAVHESVKADARYRRMLAALDPAMGRDGTGRRFDPQSMEFYTEREEHEEATEHGSNDHDVDPARRGRKANSAAAKGP